MINLRILMRSLFRITWVGLKCNPKVLRRVGQREVLLGEHGDFT